MDKRYQVFISSTYEDLQEERKEVMQALLELDCIPAGMELFPASNDDQWTLIKKVIDDCDYYILILAGRYGSTSDTGMGYTEMEYRYAIETHKPVIAFLHKNPDDIKAIKTEKTPEGQEKLKDFRNLVQTKMTKYWTSPADLGSVVSRSMVKLMKEVSAIGWVKADNIFNENTAKEILNLKKENDSLKIQLYENQFKAPEGTELLAQGEDNTIISYECEWEYKGESYEIKVHKIPYITKWNFLFKAISPYFIKKVREKVLKNEIDEMFKNACESEIAKLKKRVGFLSIVSCRVSDSDFFRILVQFRALGLIKNDSINKDLWMLTPYGDHFMTNLIAEKR